MTPGRPALLAAILCIPAARALRAQDTAAARSAPRSTYTEEQAARGEDVFRRICAQCHVVGQFTGGAFRTAWAGRPAFELFELIRTRMPEDTPGRLRRQEYADVVSYLLKLNGAAPGGAELAPDADSLRLVRFPTAPDPRP